MATATEVSPSGFKSSVWSYAILSAVAGLVNFASFGELTDNLDAAARTDVANILTSITAVSIAAFCLQVYYIARGRLGRKWKLDTAVAVAVGIATGLIALLAINASSGFALQIGLLLALTVLLLALPARVVSGLIFSRQWGYLGLANMLASGVRGALWFFGLLDHSQLAVLTSLVITQSVMTIFFLVVGAKTDPPSVSPRKHDALVLVSLLMFVLLVAASLPALRTTFGDETSSYVVGMYAGRGLLFGALVAVCIFIPDLVRPSSDGLELSRRIRTAWLVVLVFISATTIGAIVSLPSVAEQILGSEQLIDRGIALFVVLGWTMIAVVIMPFFQLITLGSRLPLLLVLPLVVIVAGRFFSTGGLLPAAAFFASSLLVVLLIGVPFVARNAKRVGAIRVSMPSQPQTADGSVTVVVPSYNPGKRVVDTIDAIHAAFSGAPSLRVIVVSDGSTDESVTALDAIEYSWFRHVALPTNKGKGAALRRGFAESMSEYTAFVDADGDIPPSLLPGMLSVMIAEKADVVFGSKWHPDSQLRVSPPRWLLSKVHHGLQRILFRIDISDTQAGIKIYRTEHLHHLGPVLQEHAFSLDLELFVALSASGHGRFIETPLVIDRTGPSTIRLRHVLVSFMDMLRIFWRARVALYYNREIDFSTRETMRKT